MILSQLSPLDMAVVVALALPLIVLQAGVVNAILAAIQLCIHGARVPLEYAYARFLTRRRDQHPAIRDTTIFEGFMIRGLRVFFPLIPREVFKATLSTELWTIVLRWRLLSRGFFKFPVHVERLDIRNLGVSCKATWIKQNPTETPDIVVYYVHGGCFGLGSVAFYLEYLLAWHDLLVKAGFKNPAILALDYTLAPEKVYPTQILEVLQGYRVALETAGDASNICLAGDSAGGALLLSLLLEIGAQAGMDKLRRRNNNKAAEAGTDPRGRLAAPGMAILISPWVTLQSKLHGASPVDYLERERLWAYGRQYAGQEAMMSLSPASPGSCRDEAMWKAASPTKGYYVMLGKGEMLSGDIDDFVARQKGYGVRVKTLEDESGIHAWPMVRFILSSPERRLEGVDAIVKEISANFARK